MRIEKYVSSCIKEYNLVRKYVNLEHQATYLREIKIDLVAALVAAENDIKYKWAYPSKNRGQVLVSF